MEIAPHAADARSERPAGTVVALDDMDRRLADSAGVRLLLHLICPPGRAVGLAADGRFDRDAELASAADGRAGRAMGDAVGGVGIAYYALRRLARHGAGAGA